jgi:hypothetical protein
MSSKVTKKSNKEEKTTKCKNCRQDISKDKMFLHEGFCLRNNVFCSHCEKVFLKKDYELHVKLLKNKNSEKDNNSPTFSQKSKETMEETHKPSSFTEESDNYINNNFIQINPKPSLQVVQMPITELYKINAPIFVSENGQVVSDKNKNEYLLPLLGINFRSSKISEKVIDDIVDKGDIFKENNTISENCYDFQGLTNLLNKNNIISNNNTITAINRDLRTSNFSIELSSIHDNNSLNNSSLASKTIEINKCVQPFKEENKENIPQNIITNQPKRNTFYINKSIANHSHKIYKRNYNYFTHQQTPTKLEDNIIIISNSIKRNVKQSMPLDSSKKRTPKRKDNSNFDDSIENNNNCYIYKKEPKDSNAKRRSGRKNFKFYRLSGNKNIETNYYSENNKLNGQLNSINMNDDFGKNKYIFNRSDNQINKGKKKKSKRISDIPKPKRKERANLSEVFSFEDEEETCLDAKKRETLKRQFNASKINISTLNCDKKIGPGFITNLIRNNNQFNRDVLKISLKKKLFEVINEENDDKNFPVDNIREPTNNLKRNKLIIRKHNLSYNFDSVIDDEKINNKKTNLKEKSLKYLKSGKIDNFLFFNNDKKVLKYPKNKNA